MKTSEFGKGLCYCLGLFLAHEWFLRPLFRRKTEPGSEWPISWFNAASDHLYELQTQHAPKHLQKRILKFQKKCLDFGHGLKMMKATEKDVYWACQEAKTLLRLIDKHNKISVCKGTWE